LPPQKIQTFNCKNHVFKHQSANRPKRYWGNGARDHISNPRIDSRFFITPLIHIGEEIRNHLAAQKRSVAWLANQIRHDPSNLRKILKNPYVPTDLLYRISVILGKDFFACFSRLLSENDSGENHPIIG